MSSPFITFPLKRPVLITVIYIIVIIIGLFSLWRLPIDLMPEITNPTITVITNYGNAGPQEVEELITRPIESSLAGVQGIQELTSQSSEGRSRIRATFVWGTNLDEAVNDIRDRIDRTIGRLPDDVDRPMIRKFDVSASPIVFLGVSSKLDPADVRQLIEDQVQYRLERVDGVASVDIWGGARKEIQVKLRSSALEVLKISPDMIVTALRQENKNIPAGSVDIGNKEIIVRTFAEYSSIDDIKNAVIATRDGVGVTVGDVAEISDGVQEITSIVRINSEPGFRLSVSKQSGMNTVAVAKGVRREIEKINKDLPQLKIMPLTDTSIFIRQAINSVGHALAIGGLFSILVLLLFLRNFSSTLIISTAIPISVIATFAFIYFGGLTLNMMSFGGLALGIGMLVDNAIVVLDSIFHHREQGKNPMQGAVDGAAEVASAITASTMTTLVVFFPVIFIRGMSGILFGQLAFVVSFSMACSLVVALTLVPMLTTRFLKMSQTGYSYPWLIRVVFDTAEKVFKSLETLYAKALNWALNHRFTVIAASALTFTCAVLMIPLVGQELMPSSDESEVRVNIEMEVGTRMEVTDSAVVKIQEVIKKAVPEAVYILSTTENGHTGDIRVSLVSKRERNRSSADVANDLRRAITGIPGATVRVREGQGLSILRMGQSESNTIGIELRGHDLDIGQTLASEISDIVKNVKGITDVKISRQAGMPEYALQIDRKKAADLGLTATQIGTVVQTAMNGASASSLRRDGKEYVINVRLAEDERKTLEQLENMTIVNKQGMAIPLQTVVHIVESSGPVQIERRDRERIITVNVNYSGRDLGSIVEDIRSVLGKVTVPSEFAVVIRGDYEEQQKSSRELMVGLVLALLLIYLVMAGQFESFKDPFIILFAIPMALIGIVLMLYLSGTPFSMQAYIGCIVLAGIVVNNAIILVDYTNRLRRQYGFELINAIKSAGIRRLRPILMTKATTVLGLMPLALALGEGGETQAPMARVVIGGLLSSSFITLLLVPVIYSLIEERHQRKKARKQQMAGTAAPVTTALILFFAVISTAVTSVHAEQVDTLRYSLEDVLTRAARHNPLVRIEHIDVNIANKIRDELNYRYEPSITASLKQNRTLENGISTAPEYEGSVMVSEVLPTGTGINLKGAVAPNSRSTKPNTDFLRSGELSITQALLANGGPGVNLAPVRKASIDMDMRHEELIGYAQRLFADIEKVYWELYLAKQEIAIHQQSLDLANRLLFESQERLNVGKIAPLDLVTVKAEAATREKNLINANTTYLQKKYRLSYLISDSVTMWDIPLTITDKPARPQTPDSLTLHIQTAQTFRSDLKLAEYQLSKGELDIVQTRNGLLPKLDFFITLSGTAYAQSFSDALNNSSDNASALAAGLTLSLPVTNGAARERHQKALLSQKQYNLSIDNLGLLIELDVRTAWSEVNRSISLIRAAETARKLQEEKLSAEQARLSAGKTTEYMVLQAQRDLITAQLDKARAEVAYCNAVTDLYLKDGSLLERRGVKPW